MPPSGVLGVSSRGPAQRWEVIDVFSDKPWLFLHTFLGVWLSAAKMEMKKSTNLHLKKNLISESPTPWAHHRMRVFSLLNSKEMPLVGISQEVLGYEKLRVILPRDEVILPRVRVKAAFGWEERAQSQAVHLGGWGGPWTLSCLRPPGIPGLEIGVSTGLGPCFAGLQGKLYEKKMGVSLHT